MEQSNHKYYDAVRALAVKAAAKQFQVTESYVRICLKGIPRSERSMSIREYCEEKYSELQKVLAE
ncbi:hypothetical protein [Taibaiella koreensis]|uniref:hypothetical protein n=1 Tax=Taibaiella koreensis TaxID=1268548 RepID=UPI000E599AF1|nr:hypothetical protein [Taibaiella koreensis]